ncbi:MAG: winged helix-turn-helix domain-containing protein [Slackia sp.]
MSNCGIVVSRNQLLIQVWGYEVAGETRTVDAHIQTLRKKIGEIDQEAASLIETVRGVGYRMKG